MSSAQVGPVDFLVRRDDLRKTELRPAPNRDDIELKNDEVLLCVEKFGFTSNNITYATLGVVMRYWDFFPGPQGYGRIPVWGYAEVVRSSHPDIEERERIFGYLPMSAYLVVRADKVTDAGFVDGAAHRADLPSVYQRYGRLGGDPTYEPELEDMQALWRPLYMTSFGAADFLAEKDLYGAKSVVFSSASSKTALGIAFLLSKSRPSDCRVIALTSTGNVGFCERVGYYDEVLTYDDLEALPSDQSVVYVDMAGNASLVERLRNHLGDNFKKTVIIGATQWEQLQPDDGLGVGDSEFFFLPTWLVKRREEWGPSEFSTRYGEAWAAFLPSVNDWMKVVTAEGPVGVEAAYRNVLEGKIAPEEGQILSLNPQRLPGRR